MKASKTTQDEQLKEQFAQVVASLKNSEKIHNFFLTFLTENEYLMLSRRLEILRMLEDDQPYAAVQQELSVSSATIAAVSQLRELEVISDVIKRVKQSAKKRFGWL